MRAIYIMWKRQLKRFGRAKARIAISLFQPILFLIAFGFGFGPIYEQAGGGNYINFLAPGIIAMAILFGSVMNGIETIWDKQFGFLKETLVAPVSRISIMLGRTLGGATVGSLQGLMVLIITLFLGFEITNYLNLLFALIMMFIMSTFFTAFGIALASKIDDMHAFPMVINFLVMPTFFLSGALFSLENLPAKFQFLTNFNPLIYGVDALRGLLSGVYEIGLFTDIVVLVPCTILMIIIGAYSSLDCDVSFIYIK